MRKITPVIITISLIIAVWVPLTYMVQRYIPKVESKKEVYGTVIAAGGDDNMQIIKSGAAWVPIYHYEGYVIYNDKKYSINSERAYRYCKNNIGAQIPAQITIYTLTNGSTQVKITLLMGTVHSVPLIF